MTKKKSYCLIKLVYFYDYHTIIYDIHIYLLHLISKKIFKKLSYVIKNPSLIFSQLFFCASLFSFKQEVMIF